MTTENKQVYISYAWGGESERIVNELDTDLKAKGIEVVRDKRDLGFKGMIRDFMQEIGRGHAVIVVISDKYLKSPNCMFELVEIAKNKDFYDRIFPIVLGDADIYNPVQRIAYIKHWEDKLKELDEAMKSVSSANLQGMREEIDSYDEIRDNISNLTFFLKDMNTLTAEMHENSNFSSLISALEDRLQKSGFKPPQPTSTTEAAASPTGLTPYLTEAIKRLQAENYVEMRGERYGEIRFKLAYQKDDTDENGTDYYRVLILEKEDLTEELYLYYEKEFKKYVKEAHEELGINIYGMFLIMTSQISDALKNRIYENKPQPQEENQVAGYAELIVYSSSENDIVFPKKSPLTWYGSLGNNIKRLLAP